VTVTLSLVNESTGATVASHVELALDRAARRRGLLGRTSLAPTAAMVLSPCWMVHTAFMQFPIDVLFLDAQGRVVHVARQVRPWRAALSVRAQVVIELPAGAAERRDVNVGDRVTFLEHGADSERGALTAQLPLGVHAC
jgi:uncharacterized membrane protein (UPF0127 family)